MSSEAVDFRAAAECFAEGRKLTRADLRSLGVLTAEEGRVVPSVGGLLLFGAERLTSFPDAFLRAGRFAGTDKSRCTTCTHARPDDADLSTVGH